MAGIELQGDANLTLVVDGTFTVTGGKAGERGKAYEVNASGFAGINVPVGTTLVVRGNGTVRAYGGDAGAGSEPYFWSRYDGTSSSLREIGGGAGGGGAGAGIGGNGGASGKGGGAVETGVVSSENGYHGGPGASAGSIYIYDAVTVYAYGGGGASGGRSGNGAFGDAGGGGGYPAAGIGGGGAGAGGGSNGSGGGGFSGGAGEASFTDANGGWQQYTPGGINGNIPAGGDRPQDRGSGGAYYGVGTLSTGSSTQKRGYIGGGGGPWGGLDRLNQHNGGNGGSAGNGGEVKQSSTAKVYAYNGSSTTTAGKQWETGKQTPIYWQNGHSLALGRTTATTKAQMESGSYFNADRLLSYENGLTHSRLGVGSGAGYTETSNGSYLFFFVRKFLTPAVTPFSVILKNQPRNC